MAKTGSATAGELQTFYGILQQDVLDTYELDQFRVAYDRQLAYDAAIAEAKATGKTLPAPPDSEGHSEVEASIQSETQASYNALAARGKLAGAIKAEYDAYGALASYDASADLVIATGALLSAAESAAAFAFPASAVSTGGPAGSLAQSGLTDIARQIGTLQQNKKLLLQSQQMVSLIQKFKQFFDAEKILYGGDERTTDSNGQVRMSSGIAGQKAAAYRTVAMKLVKSEAVISTGMVTRVLGDYDLAWPASQQPFREPALKAGIMRIIAMRAYPVGQTATDAASQISKSLGDLVALHRQLAKKEPVSIAEALGDLQTAQLSLDRMKIQNLNVSSFEKLIKSLEGAKQ